MCVLQRKSANDLDRTTRVYTRQLSGLSPNQINVVMNFVDVVCEENLFFLLFISIIGIVFLLGFCARCTG